MDKLLTLIMASGPRRDDPDARSLAHLVALREARHEAAREATHDVGRSSPLAWLARSLGFRPHARALIDPAAQCCAA